MRKLSLILGLVLLGTALYSQNQQGAEDWSAIYDQYPPESLEKEEEESLLFMREEEKLARDVYFALYEKWNLNIFRNIGNSEQTHMDQLKVLIDRYNLTDPVSKDEPGIFENDHLQNLYNDLTAQGSRSLEEALKVGATIEDLDIYDLEEALDFIDNQDIRLVYLNLTKGSRNHLRSFSRQLQRYGETYTNQYISDDYLQKVLGTSNEGGMILDPRQSF